MDDNGRILILFVAIGIIAILVVVMSVRSVFTMLGRDVSQQKECYDMKKSLLCMNELKMSYSNTYNLTCMSCGGMGWLCSNGKLQIYDEWEVSKCQ